MLVNIGLIQHIIQQSILPFCDIAAIQKLYLNATHFYALPNLTPFHISHCFLGQLFFPMGNTG